MVIDEKRINLTEKLRKPLLYHLVIVINMTANAILPPEQNRIIIEQSILLLGKYLENTQKLLKSKEEKNKNHKVFRIS